MFSFGPCLLVFEGFLQPSDPLEEALSGVCLTQGVLPPFDKGSSQGLPMLRPFAGTLHFLQMFYPCLNHRGRLFLKKVAQAPHPLNNVARYTVLALTEGGLDAALYLKFISYHKHQRPSRRRRS